MRKPHTPFLLDGFSDLVLKRSVEWGDGWFPAYIGDGCPPDRRMCARAAKNRAIRQRYTSGNKKFEIATILAGDVIKDILRRYEDADADRVAIILQIITSVEEGRRAIEKITEDILTSR
jgi:hypothetical protein